MSRSPFFYLLGTLFIFLSQSGMAAQIPQSEPENISITDESKNAQDLQDAIESIRKEVVAQLDRVYELAEDYGLDIAAGALKVDNTQEEMKLIMELKQIIEQLKSTVYIQTSYNTLSTGSQATAALVDYVRQGLTHGLTTLETKPLDLIKRSRTDEPEVLEAIEQRIATTRTVLTQIEKQSSSVGLSWFNKAYRFCTDRLLKPAVDYKIIHTAGLVTFAGIVTAELLFRSQSTNPTLRSWLGYPLHVDENGTIDRVWHSGIDLIYNQQTGKMITHNVGFERPALWLGKAEHLIKNISRALTPALIMSFPLFQKSYASLYKGTKKYITNKASALHAYMQGGQYKMRVQEMKLQKTFDDLIGLDHAKEIGKTLIKYLEDPERFARKKLVPEKGYILYGKSRTGKSEFAKALSGEIYRAMKNKGNDVTPFTFFEVKTEDVLKHGIQFIHDFAQMSAPCVIFIDEIDLLGLQRAGGNPQLLSEFLSTMSGFVDADPKKQVIMIAATNKPENIDFALRQRGRFGKSIYFELPNLEHRHEYIVKRCGELCLPFDEATLARFALDTEGATYEDINAIIKSGIQRSKIFGIPFDAEQLERSIDEEFRNILFNHEYELSQVEKIMKSAYLIGKASCMLLKGYPRMVSKITLLPVQMRLKEKLAFEAYLEDGSKKTQEMIEFGAIFTIDPNDGLRMPSTQALELELMTTLAGITAQQVITNDATADLMIKDKQAAHKIALAIVLEGNDLETLSKKTRELMITKAEELVIETQKTVRELLEKHKKRINMAQAYLIQNDMIDGNLLKYLLTQELPDELNPDDLPSQVDLDTDQP